MIALLLARLALGAVALEEPPRPGVETVVVVTDEAGAPRPGETVRVVHRPGLGRERELAIGITDARGRVRWTPAEGGVAVIRAGDELLPIRVAPGEIPAGPLALSIVLLLAALGGLGYGLVPPRARPRRA